MGPQIVFEDDNMFVINKLAGMVVNRADTVKDVKTVQDWAEEKILVRPSQLEARPESDFFKRGGIVHRLDKETSGIMLVAKSPEAFENLQKQFKAGKVEKTYIALAHGRLAPREGEIHVPIGRLPWNRMRFGILPEGRESKTLYRVLEYKHLKVEKFEEDVTFLEVYPKTGRTHQIRVHLQYLHHPIVGDPLYSGRKNMKRVRKLLTRQFLHAHRISFNHPMTGERITFEAPLPQELKDFLSGLN